VPDQPSPGDWAPPPAVADFVRLDHDRASRRGYPEAVLCDAKTLEQVLVIAEQVRTREARTLFTRVRADQVQPLLDALPGAALEADARIVAFPGTPPEPTGQLVVVLAAGTSDVPVAREAAVTARHLGRPVELVVDVGVAGLHRVLEQLDLLRSARAIVVAAGMDGALPGVVAGLVAAPVIAVPTSVGYGAAFAGLAPLLTMLNACAPGVAVVNIDNGYGAGHLAAQIAAS
jgi:NCAIR mutase (PurE)-related protein